MLKQVDAPYISANWRVLNKFLMHLNKDGIHSDMLYVKKGTSTPQEVVVKNLSEVLDSMNYGERLRFATVTNSKMNL